jgi:AmiR/NasT family two-component response regulator
MEVPDQSSERIADSGVQGALDREAISRLQAQAAFDRDLIAQLQIALVSARRIGVAMGVLMHTHTITEESAFHRAADR